jgi:hypothetical protein
MYHYYYSIIDPDLSDRSDEVIKSDITILNTMKERIETTLMDVLEEYRHTRIDER